MADVFPWGLDVWMTESAPGDWRIAGNQELAEVGTSSIVRITARPPTEEEVSLLPGIEVWNDLLVDGVLRDHCYMLPLDTRPSWYFLVGCAGDATFPLFLMEGDMLTERETARDHTHDLGHPSAGLQQYLVLHVSSEQVDARIARVRVTGPGLPDAGLTLVRPNPSLPRAHFIFQGDSWNWDAFNGARCANMDPVEDCGLDWTAVHSGARYTYEFLNGEGTSLGTSVRRLMGEPHTDEEWLARRDEVFPQFTLSTADRLTFKKLLDTGAGAPYTAGGTKTVSWKVPTDPTVKMDFVSLWRQYFLGDTGRESDRREESCSYSLYGKTTRSRSCTWTADQLTTWAWCDLGARDVWGNLFSHEVFPGNPY